MKMNCFYGFLVLLSILGFVTSTRAQVEEELELSVSRDFGSSDGTGNIQGTFSMKVTGPSNLVKVQFYIDNTMIAEDTAPPSRFNSSPMITPPACTPCMQMDIQVMGANDAPVK